MEMRRLTVCNYGNQKYVRKLRRRRIASGGEGKVDALPQWTSKVEKRGLDPLGMQNSGVTLHQALLPGISNITLRMRYYASSTG